MLYCATCQRAVAGGAVCTFCRTGFVTRLVCGSCGRQVPSGASACGQCAPEVVDLTPFGNSPQSFGLSRLGPPITGIPGLTHLPEDVPAVIRQAGKFGAQATVFMNGRDAEILTKVGQVAAMLHALAMEMNSLQGFMPSTRDCIKGCRKLALDLTEEVEVRRGPRG